MVVEIARRRAPGGRYSVAGLPRFLGVVTLSLAVLTSGVGMADDSPELTALKEQLARAQAERDLAKAKLEKAQSDQQLQGEIVQAQNAKAVAEAQTAALAQQKAAADAKAAAIAADAAAEKAKYGSVAGSSLTGDVTVGTGAGNAEASLLAAAAVGTAAARIADRVTPKVGKTQVFVFAGAQAQSFPNWRTFRNALHIVSDSFSRADLARTQADAASEAVGLAPPAAASRTFGVGAAITGVGAALDSLSKIGSYFQTNYAVAGATVAGSDDDLLAVNVLERLPGASYPARYMPPQAGTELASLVEPVAKGLVEAQRHLRDVQASSRKYMEAGAKERVPKRKAEYQAVASAYDRAADSYALAIKGLGDLETSLAADKNGVPLAVLVADEKNIADGLAKGGSALFVRLNTAAGANYTKKNLWTFFGTMPFYVMGGAVASYTLIDGKTGAVTSAGQFPIHSGYYKVSDVAEAFAGKPAAARDPGGTPPGRDP